MVISRKTAYASFADRLGRALDAMEPAGCPRGRGRARWVQVRFKISHQAARKWLNGESIPDRANLARIAQDTGFSADWLLTGAGRERVEQGDPLRLEIRAVWESLSDDQRRALVSYGHYLSSGAQQGVTGRVTKTSEKH